MIDRRQFGFALGAASALALTPHHLLASRSGLIRKRIPSTGEAVPAIGLGTSATFAQLARSGDTSALSNVIATLYERGATLIDTAPAYGTAEEVAGTLAKELKLAKKVFWATKVNAAGRDENAKVDPAAARAQLDASFARLGVRRLDLVQVHNLADVDTHLSILKTLKKAGRVRYLGVTTSSDAQYARLIDVMRNEPLDFIGIDYAIDNRGIEETILPLARERKIAVLAYLPFGRTRLFQRVAGQDVPEWAREFDAETWAQFFLKYVISHPAVTAATPATTKVKHLLDNLGGGAGRLPEEATRKKMAAFIDALPQ